jgi:hypothetical protein
MLSVNRRTRDAGNMAREGGCPFFRRERGRVGGGVEEREMALSSLDGACSHW